MNRLALILHLTLLGLSGHSLAQEKVDIKGITSKIKIEEIVYGHLEEINGKYKLRATEVTFAPGAHIGPHHHIGPGVRFVASGELAFTEVARFKTSSFICHTDIFRVQLFYRRFLSGTLLCQTGRTRRRVAL